jgi:enoyl-CoA hydratase
VPIHYEPKAHGVDHLLLITIDRPESKNSLDLEHFHLLAKAWRDFEADDDLWVAIITGVGRCFMSGADLKTYIPEITKLAREVNDGGVDTVRGYSLRDGTDAVLKGSKLAKPIIAAINGPCVAGGMEMLGGVDIRVATDHARFGVLEPARGLFAGGGTTVRLPRQIAFPAAMELLLCADPVSADQAMEMGLLNKIVPEDELMDAALDYARRILKNAPLAVQATKRSVLEGLALDLKAAFKNEGRISQEVFATEDAKEGPQAFAEKRPPVWQAR